MDNNPYKAPQADCRLPQKMSDGAEADSAPVSVWQFIAGGGMLFLCSFCCLLAVLSLTIAIVEPTLNRRGPPLGWFAPISCTVIFGMLAAGFFWSFRRVIA